MPWLLNLIYLFALTLAAPWLLWRRWRQGKRIGGAWAKLTGNVSPATTSHEATPQNVWLHAVSVGEVLLLQPLIRQLQVRFPNARLTLSVTTVTGREVAEKTYPELLIIWFPFDFSWAVRRALEQIKPSLILLAELELWPNFITFARSLSIPMVVVNGRMSQHSFQGYRRFRWLTQKLLEKINCFAVQQHDYATRLKELGMPEDRLVVTGSVKFDGVAVDRLDPAVQHLRELLNIGQHQLVWVVGSTQAPEEAWALDIYHEARKRFPELVLILVPRHRERFDEVAALLSKANTGFIRRSELSSRDIAARNTCHSMPILVDSLGELRAIWGLADVGFVGGSFNDRGGQNMIEPAAYGVALTFGPNTWNFKQIVKSLLEQHAALEVKTKDEWQTVTLRLLADAQQRRLLGERARLFVASQQGATERTMELLAPFLSENTSVRPSRSAA